MAQSNAFSLFVIMKEGETSVGGLKDNLFKEQHYSALCH